MSRLEVLINELERLRTELIQIQSQVLAIEGYLADELIYQALEKEPYERNRPPEARYN